MFSVSALEPDVAFVSGVASDGTLAAQSFATWTGATPAAYGTDTTAFKWAANAQSHNAGTAGGTVSYYVDPATIPSAAANAMIDATLTLWSDEANIHFVRAASASAANVVVQGAQAGQYADANTAVVESDVGSATLGHVYGQSTLNLTGSVTFAGSLAQVSQSVTVLLHEEGHIIGLGHAGAYDGGSAVTPLTAQDNVQYSLMSYVNGNEAAQWGRTLLSSTTNAAGATTRTFEIASPTTPMMVDILAAQRLYGAPTGGALSGGQTFGFNCNVADASKLFFDFTQNTRPVVTLFDTGLNNTLDLSGFAAGAVINLAQGGFTSCNGQTNNVGIAYGTVISAAIGGAGDDFFMADGTTGAQAFDGRGGVNFIGTASAAGSGTVAVDMTAGTLTKGGTLDATFTNTIGLQLGADTATVTGLSAGVGLVYGGTGALTFTGNGATDYIQASTGSNAIFGGAGNEIVFSNGGVDAVRGGSAANFLQAGQTAASQDTFTGTGGADFVYAGAGTTTLFGGHGTEILTGGSGLATLVGATSLDAQGHGGLNILNGGAGTDVFYAGVGLNLMYETTGHDTFVGGAGTSYIAGGSGTSTIYAGSGAVTVTAGAGNQTIQAGTGNTVFNDTAAYLTAGRSDRIDHFQSPTAATGNKGTSIYMPAAVAANTHFLAQNGGTAIVTAVAGGQAQIFVSNTPVAAVIAQTHFTL